MGFWAFIIPILVQLIIAFITELLKSLNPQSSVVRVTPALPDLISAKSDFMAGIKLRFWLGPKRMQYASALYDRMHARFAVNLSDDGVFYIPGIVSNCTSGLEKLGPADLGDGMTKFTADGALNYKVLPNGLVQGGMASYLLDAAKGLITYRASVKVGKWFLTKTYESHGQYQVDPTLLNPTGLTVGKVITVGSLQMKVVSLSMNTALVTLTIVGQKAGGTAVLTTNQTVVTLQAIDATVNVFGMDLVIGLRQDT